MLSDICSFLCSIIWLTQKHWNLLLKKYLGTKEPLDFAFIGLNGVYFRGWVKLYTFWKIGGSLHQSVYLLNIYWEPIKKNENYCSVLWSMRLAEWNMWNMAGPSKHTHTCEFSWWNSVGTKLSAGVIAGKVTANFINPCNF